MSACCAKLLAVHVAEYIEVNRPRMARHPVVHRDGVVRDAQAVHIDYFHVLACMSTEMDDSLPCCGVDLI